jgi:putative ABC transport system permease protein
VGSFRVAGLYDYFPTVNAEPTTIIANLEHLSIQAGAELPHLIWLQLSPAADRARLLRDIEQLGVSAGNPQDAQALLRAEQARLERVGIFGTLSVGFLAATVMAILALLVHSYAALQERLYQFGVLRAIGLRHRAVLSQVGLEYGVLTLFGASVGAWIGLAATELFAPFLRIPEKAGAPPPPLIPIIQAEATVYFALTFAAAMVLAELVVLAHALSRRLFDALRIGHQG